MTHSVTRSCFLAVALFLHALAPCRASISPAQSTPPPQSQNAVCPPRSSTPQPSDNGKLSPPQNPRRCCRCCPILASCISSAIIPQPPKVDDDKCTATAVREAQATLLQACTDAKAFRLENAAKEYAGVLKSCDLQSRMSAIAGYREVNQAMELWWWRWGKYVPGLRWWYEYPDESDWLTWKLGKKLWASFGAFLKILADLLLLALIVFYILRPLAKAGAVVLYALISFPSRAKTWYLTRENQKGGRWFSIHRVRDQMSGAMAWAQDAWKKPGARTLKRVLDWYSREHTEWILPFLGEARLVLPDCVNDTSEHELFRRQLNACTEEIRTRVQNTGVSWIAGSTALLSLPSAVTDDLVKNLPAIKGANFGPIFAWFLSLFKYFGWRAECGETYLEDSKTIEAFASLHWAWITRKRWQISTPAASKSDLSLTARKLAMQILSVRFDNRRAKTRNEFENGEHFLLFTQAAYGLQRYEEIGQVESPDRGAMQKELQSATGKFEQCVSLYPSHALGRFYLAYTHILLNQDALVVPELAERIETLRDEPVYVPSSYLDRAIELFEELAGEDHEWLKPIVTYNWAKALVKRDRPATASVVADLTTAKDTVTELSKNLMMVAWSSVARNSLPYECSVRFCCLTSKLDKRLLPSNQCLPFLLT